MRRGFSVVKCIGVSSVCALVLTGCNRHKDKEEPTTEPQAQSEQTVSSPAVSTVDCQSDAITGQMHNTIIEGINAYVGQAANSMAKNGNVKLNGNDLSSKTASLLVDVQNVRQGSNTDTGMTTCQASVSVAVANEDMFLASQMFAAANQPSLEQRLAQSSIILNNNMLVDNNVTFVVSPANDSNTVKLVGQLPLLQAVGNVLASATLKQSLDAEQEARRRQIQQKIAQEQQKARQAAKALSERLAAQQRQEEQEREQAIISQPNQPEASEPLITSPSLDSGLDNTATAKQAEPSAMNKPTIATQEKHQENEQPPEFNVPGAEEVIMRIIEKDETY